ncbi:unnamed protein product [Lactuca saligna]|uniref:Uncharacterized protein n=1 Tax=Lactuca saligna TaxID=75948 RepID=A0AA36ENK2_LACSI|nr:unnamed protein product [Lactuca saligna]
MEGENTLIEDVPILEMEEEDQYDGSDLDDSEHEDRSDYTSSDSDSNNETTKKTRKRRLTRLPKLRTYQFWIVSWVDETEERRCEEAAKGRRSSIGRDKQQWNNEKVKGERRGFVAPLLTGNAQENTSDGGASAENRDRRRKETGRVP